MGNPAGVRRDFDALEKRRFEAIRLVEQGVNQLNRLEAPLLQCVEIASNSSGIAHTRLDALSLDKYRYIMRDSIGGQNLQCALLAEAALLCRQSLVHTRPERAHLLRHRH